MEGVGHIIHCFHSEYYVNHYTVLLNLYGKNCEHRRIKGHFQATFLDFLKVFNRAYYI